MCATGETRGYYTPLEAYRNEALKAAKDFHYGESVYSRIKNANTESEIQRIMISARHKKMDDEEEAEARDIRLKQAKRDAFRKKIEKKLKNKNRKWDFKED